MVAALALTALPHAGIGWFFSMAACDDLSFLKESSSPAAEEHWCSVCGVLVGEVWVTGCAVIGVVEQVVECTLVDNNCSSNVCVLCV